MTRQDKKFNDSIESGEEQIIHPKYGGIGKKNIIQ
jgi:hypothetical protein